MPGLFSGQTFGPGGLFGGSAAPGQEDPQSDARMAMMAQLLQSGGYSPQRSSFGQIMGQALMAGQAARKQTIQSQQAREAAALDKQYKEAQIGKLNRPTDDLGAYQPGDYTPDSWAKFVTGGQKDPALLVRYEAPRQQTSKPFQQVTRTRPDGSTELGVMDTRTGTYEWTGAIVPPGKKAEVDAAGAAAGAATGNIAGDIQKKSSNATVVKGLIDDARSVLKDDSTTGSALGSVGDTLGAVVGHSTAGARNTAKLKVIQSGLMLNMPRMEGPQSDRDVQLYQQAAAQLGDSTVPADTRSAALDTIEAIQNRYQERAAGAAPVATPAAQPKETAAQRAKRLGL